MKKNIFGNGANCWFLQQNFYTRLQFCQAQRESLNCFFSDRPELLSLYFVSEWNTEDHRPQEAHIQARARRIHRPWKSGAGYDPVSSCCSGEASQSENPTWL